jgi:heme-binding uptake protein ChaN (Tiki superfamily)
MASVPRIRIRRSAALLHALAKVEREIRATDPHTRRKYLRDFTEAYTQYSRVLLPAQLAEELVSADILLVGDYHALPSCQQYAAELVENLRASGKPVILGLEMIFARDQRILDEWQQGRLSDDELRQRLRHDREWGYDWEPTRELLARARGAGALVRGLDCLPRGDLRRISGRDRHAALEIADIRFDYPDAAMVVFFGESHLAPQHLPKLVRASCPNARVLTVLQNVDALYWQASDEPRAGVRAVQVNDDTVCVFNATPLEKYERYRRCIERWRQA